MTLSENLKKRIKPVHIKLRTRTRTTTVVQLVFVQKLLKFNSSTYFVQKNFQCRLVWRTTWKHDLRSRLRCWKISTSAGDLAVGTKIGWGNQWANGNMQKHMKKYTEHGLEKQKDVCFDCWSIKQYLEDLFWRFLMLQIWQMIAEVGQLAGSTRCISWFSGLHGPTATWTCR